MHELKLVWSELEVLRWHSQLEKRELQKTGRVKRVKVKLYCAFMLPTFTTPSISEKQTTVPGENEAPSSSTQIKFCLSSHANSYTKRPAFNYKPHWTQLLFWKIEEKCSLFCSRLSLSAISVMVKKRVISLYTHSHWCQGKNGLVWIEPLFSSSVLSCETPQSPGMLVAQ